MNKIKEFMLTRKEFKMSDTRVKNRALRTIEKARATIKAEEEQITIKDKYTLRTYISNIIKDVEFVLDVETTGLHTEEDINIGICLYSPSQLPAYVPILHTDLEGNLIKGQIELEDIIKEFKVLESADVKWINHNLKFDAKMLYNDLGIDLIDKMYWDTQLGARVLNENEPKALKPLYDRYILKKKPTGQSFSDLFEKLPFNFVPMDIAEIYGGNDGIKTYRLYQFQKQYLDLKHERKDFRQLATVFFEIEMPLLPIVTRMEIKGVKIDREYAKELEKIYGEVVKENMLVLQAIVDNPAIQKRIAKHAELTRLMKDNKINFKSNPQLQAFAYDILKMPTVKREGRACNKAVLESWENTPDLLPIQRKFVDSFQIWRKNDKLLRDFIIKIPKALDENDAVHTNFNQMGTDTGRFSSSHPIHKINLQQIPSRDKYIRKMFVAREGKALVGSDYSQIEPRVLASLAKESHMMEAYQQGLDLYAMMASKIFSKPYEECLEFHPQTGEKQVEGKQRRTFVKSILLGIMYDRGANGIASQCGQTKEWAEKIIEDFFKEFPQIKLLRIANIYKAEKLGYVETIFGRKRRLREMKQYANNKSHPLYIEATRKCLNAVIQGSSADIMKLAMIAIAKDEQLKKLGLEILMTVHDEVICEVDKENAIEAGERLADIMKEVGEKAIGLVMKCDVEITDRWSGEDISNNLK